jgi:phage tail sheath gpL-like
MAWTDAANLTALETELTARFGPMTQNEGHAYAAARGTVSTLGTLGDSRNSPNLTVMGTGTSPTPPDEAAAIVAGLAAFHGNIDPARPFQTLAMPGMMPPAEAERWTRAERNLLLLDGISTFTVDAGGVCRIERLITTRNLNALGILDYSYLDVNTLLTLYRLRYQVRARISQRFPRHKLADDGNLFGPGQAIATPKVIRAELLSLAADWVNAGLVENIGQFAEDLIVERDGDNPNRINALLPPDIVNQFRFFAGLIQFRL